MPPTDQNDAHERFTRLLRHPLNGPPPLGAAERAPCNEPPPHSSSGVCTPSRYILLTGR